MGDKTAERGRGQIMKGFVCHARDGLFTCETEPVTLCKQTCDTFIVGSS